MIEKLDKKLAGNINSFNMSQNIAVALKAINKINELVDAVNELQEMRKSCDNQIGILAEQIAKLQHDNSGKANCQENVQDKFAEQHKWIGCLCRFWFDNTKQADIGILGDIDEDEIHPYFNADLGYNYKCCEPVKPDDDIIYKGE